MLSTYFLCLLVGLSAASDYAWKSGTEYQYQVRGRTLASLHQVDNQYAGVVLKAQFIVRPKGDGVLYGRLQDTQYAQVHAKLPGGWKSQIPESQLAYRPVQMSNKPFEIIMKNGTVQELIVDKAIPNWEANIIKSVISQIQVDVQGENMIKSRYNQPAERDSNSYSAEFKTMEDTVTGKCETLYDIDELPEYILQSEPQLAPLPHLKADGEFIDVVKTRNYSNCDERIVYHYGLHEMDDWEPASAAMGDFFLKSSVSRVILSGNMKRHTIQSSVTTNKIVLKPTPNAHQKGLVVSQMNVTLYKVNAVSDQPQKVSQPQTIATKHVKVPATVKSTTTTAAAAAAQALAAVPARNINTKSIDNVVPLTNMNSNSTNVNTVQDTMTPAPVHPVHPALIPLNLETSGNRTNLP
ncbi:hypothetical protein CBL_10145 [Carabus blaptoides fortunei]